MSIFMDHMVEWDGFTSSQTISNLEFKELRGKITEGDPTKEDSDRYLELIDSGLIDDDLINQQAVQDDYELPPEAITRWEHEDRPKDDRLRQLTYDGAAEPDWLPEFSIGSSVTYAGDKFKWLGTVLQGKKPVFIPDSPFVKGEREINAKIYKYIRLCVDSRLFARVEGIKKGKTVSRFEDGTEGKLAASPCTIESNKLTNYLTCYIEIPHCLQMKECKRAKYLKFFLFGEVVNRYREAVIQRFPVLRKNRATFQEVPFRRLPKNALLDYINFNC